jgi:3-oxoacyl-[acyl-carrier protein] reductase
VVPIMRAQRYGRIVNVASTTGPVSAFERAGGYAAAKAGMVGLTRALALEVASAGVTVNAIAPGWIDTPSATDGERRAGAASPVGRSGTADEVAAAIEFLAGRDASYITGTLLLVDGGNHVVEDLAGR